MPRKIKRVVSGTSRIQTASKIKKTIPEEQGRQVLLHMERLILALWPKRLAANPKQGT
jgi:hypothetical protein